MKKVITSILIIVVCLAAFLIYSVLKIRSSSTVTVNRPNLTHAGDVHQLYTHVEHLSVTIGSRSVVEYDKIEAAKRYIVSCLTAFGYVPDLQDYDYEGRTFSNIIVTIPGAEYQEETVIVGAHYDTVYGTPGADDNASAVAVLLEMCRALKGFAPGRTLKLIFFTLEEPPVFRTEYMGSYVYAKDAKSRNENITAMICLEMVGYFSDQKGGQSFPLPLMSTMYSTTPDFIAVVGNLKSRSLVEKVKNSLRKASRVPVESLTSVSAVPGVDLSDHRSFWEMGYPAVMVTDTAFYRNPNYHSEHDMIDTLDFNSMADLLKGLLQAAKDLAEKNPP